MNPARRPLEFNSFAEVMPEVERLLAGHDTVGSWTLPRILKHLSLVLRRSADLPASTHPRDPSQELWEEAKRQVFESRRIPEGIPVPDFITPESTLTAREEAEELRAAIAHFLASPGPVVAHPMLGPLSRDEWHQLQLIHCAHHLSFVIPKPVAS